MKAVEDMTREELRNAYLQSAARAHVMFGKGPLDIEQAIQYADRLYDAHKAQQQQEVSQ